jgi:hypothetical protein
MPAPIEPKSEPEGVVLNEKPTTQNVDNVSSSSVVTQQNSGTTMNKAKWLACLALCLAYTTAVQQNACTSAILKQIDEKLGTHSTTALSWGFADHLLARQHTTTGC